MGAAYSFAHKEGHNPMIYQRWIRRSVGNVFENWIGCLFGNIPYNFTTSHMHLHHKECAAGSEPDIRTEVGSCLATSIPCSDPMLPSSC